MAHVLFSRGQYELIYSKIFSLGHFTLKDRLGINARMFEDDL